MSDFKSRQTTCTREDAVIIFVLLTAVIAVAGIGIFGFTRLIAGVMGCF